MSPIIRRFKINGLYGYKDVEIEFRDNVLILVAGNGSGKTTILNALHAVLRRRFYRLRSLDFRTIECEFFNRPEPILIRRESIGAADEGAVARLAELARYAGISEEGMYDFVQSSYRPGERSAPNRMSPIVRKLYAESPMDWDELWDTLDTLASRLSVSGEGDLTDVSARVAEALGDVEIVYLPTYRRVENPLLSPRGKQRRPSHRLASEDAVASTDSTQINFGLEDVEARLIQLSEEVERISSIEYRALSATIIDEALADRIQLAASSKPLPDIDALSRFLARVSKDSRLGAEVGRHRINSDEQAEKRISAIANLYDSGDISKPDQVLLRYFLGRLGGVIEKTKATESMLQRFVEACNVYLGDSSDEKIFTYDPNLMKVAVINTWTVQEIPLGQLSSGEKQIVSIMAKLYLYDRLKLVLIDEPELSLSIDWQKRILPDMMNSGSVHQLLAITHSPFVFQNELDPYAGALQIQKRSGGAN
jgi:predicted ATPase